MFALQDFKVGNLLGKGSFAGVYRAVSLKTGLEVAIKMVRQPAGGICSFWDALSRGSCSRSGWLCLDPLFLGNGC